MLSRLTGNGSKRGSRHLYRMFRMPQIEESYVPGEIGKMFQSVKTDKMGQGTAIP